jgi:hypothetical protein
MALAAEAAARIRIADWCRDMLYFAAKAGRLSTAAAAADSPLTVALERIAAYCQAECAHLLQLTDNHWEHQVTGAEDEMPVDDLLPASPTAATADDRNEIQDELARYWHWY